MLLNGTVINGTMIETPHTFTTACTITTQIMAQAASNQYGGQTVTLSHLAPFVDYSRQQIRKELTEEIGNIVTSEEKFNEIVEQRVRREVKKGVRILQYQINTLMTANGQSPFVSINMYLNEAEDDREREDLALIIEEVLKQRIEGVKNEAGQWIAPAFPKLLYVLEEDNIWEDSKYYYLTKLALECTSKRMVPDYISEKIMLRDKYPEEKLLTIKQRRDQWGDESIWGINPFKSLSDEECDVLQRYVKTREKTGEVTSIIDKNNIKKKDLFPIAYPCMGAARGDETVSVKIGEDVYNNIPISDAFALIKKNTDERESDYPSIDWWNTFEGQAGVYKITYTPTGEYFIGSSKNVAHRIGEHKHYVDLIGLPNEYFTAVDRSPYGYVFEVLEGCDIDALYETKSKYVNPSDLLCVNYRESRNDAFDPKGNLYKEFQDTVGSFAHTVSGGEGTSWCRKVLSNRIFVMSNGEWQPIRAIVYNDTSSPLKLYEIKYQKGDEIKVLHVTEDHPLHTGRGRIIASDLVIGDVVIDCTTYEEYPIIGIEVTDEKYKTYDFEVDNDIFDLSGIISHNCRSFLTPDYIHYKYYGRFNCGVVTINLIDVACSSKKDINKFWKIFDERLELCHRALQIRHKRLRGTPSDVAPILWQHGALGRLEKGETIDKLLYNNYCTISLGYAGLWECVYYMTGKELTDPEGKELGLKIMQTMNDYTAKWGEAENISYSLYGTPIESTTYKFAKCLQDRWGIIEGVTDKNYVTNSYHVTVSKEISAFDKLAVESEFQRLSPGGAISYVEAPDLSKNLTALKEVVQFMYENIMYAEVNCRLDWCQKCGYEGEIPIVQDENGKLIWECPHCKNRDPRYLTIRRRVCGYIGSNAANEGRVEEYASRVIHFQ